MEILLRLALPAIFFLNASSARANFIIEISPNEAGPELAVSSPSANPVSPGAANSGQAVHWKMAYGFGNKVPLSFACRQIVPPSVNVTFGPGVSPSVPVVWKGGDTWNRVLMTAVKPLGLQLRMTYMAVAIVKNPPP